MLKGAVIGLGNIAINGHLPVYKHDATLQKEIKIVAGVDLTQANHEKAKKIFPDINLYFDIDELFEKEKLDFIDICTPPDIHKSIIEKAVKFRYHILCEKPIASSIEDALEINSMILKAPIVFLPCHQYHYSPHWHEIRKIIQSQKIGNIHFAQAQVFRVRANEGNANWNPKWRTDKKQSGGGILMDHGAHLMYLFISIFGKPIKITSTVKKLLHHNYEVEDTACVIIEFASCLVEFVLTWAGHSRQINYRFLGEKGELYVGEDHINIKYSDSREETESLYGMSRDSSHSEWFIPLIKLFISRIKNKDYNDDGLKEAITVLRAIDLAYQASEAGKTLEF